MKICAITANLGKFDPVVEWEEQKLLPDHYLEIVRLDDHNFPPRTRAMTPRLQARIPKMFGWQMFPGFDAYLWVDASCALLHPGSVEWFLTLLNHHDIALFKHPDRNTIHEESDFLVDRLREHNKYIVPRYEGEHIWSQMSHIDRDKDYVDDRLYASTSLIYRNTKKVQEMLKEWWMHTSIYHVIDQLSLPYVVKKSGVKVMEIELDYRKIPWLTYTRNLKK